MNKHLVTKLIALAIAGVFHSAEATTLSISLPNSSNIYSTAVGSFFDAKIYVNGLPDFAGFDFSLTYNSNNLSAQSLSSGSIFGTDTLSFANSISTSASTGTIHFAEALSYTSPLTEGLNIAAPTLLGTIHFKALNISTNNAINITNPQVYSFDGTSLAGTLQGASINITAAPVVPAPVPLPASALLFAPGLLSIFAAKKRKALTQA